VRKQRKSPVCLFSSHGQKPNRNTKDGRVDDDDDDVRKQKMLTFSIANLFDLSFFSGLLPFRWNALAIETLFNSTIKLINSIITCYASYIFVISHEVINDVMIMVIKF
jgi:hypothetical protein